MPIYEYQCQSCGHEMEKIQKMSDDRLKDCPACEKPALKKLVSAAAFRLKGDGWYETDFKTGSKKNALHRADSSSDGSSGKEKSDTKKSDSSSDTSKKSDSPKKSATGSSSGSAKP
ncbi:MAG: zinc ribbon domain-containing protein [Pseudomonadales bacterium]|nr:zinc ribbon domain-containing protein [Pseudomonadales bacterium]